METLTINYCSYLIAAPIQECSCLRARSESEGLPYQTLINSLIHKYAEGGYKR